MDPDTGEYREEAKKSTFFNKYGGKKDDRKKSESKPVAKSDSKSELSNTKS